MDYNLGSTLTFKCIFGYDFISIFFIRSQYMIHDRKQKLQQIIMGANKLIRTIGTPLSDCFLWIILGIFSEKVFEF